MLTGYYSMSTVWREYRALQVRQCKRLDGLVGSGQLIRVGRAWAVVPGTQEAEFFPLVRELLDPTAPTAAGLPTGSAGAALTGHFYSKCNDPQKRAIQHVLFGNQGFSLIQVMGWVGYS